MVNFLRNKLAVFSLAVGFAGALAAPANATYVPQGALTADAGTYAPVSLGTSITLDACGSTFAGYSICDLPSTNKFGIEWFIKRQEDAGWTNWLQQYTYHQGDVAPNLQKTIATGAGTVIDVPGTYFISLHVISYGDVIALPGGGYARGGASKWDDSMTFTVGNSPIVTPPTSPVPEPMAALLLLPGIVMIARRERRRRRQAVTA
ncbi:hypothetical protein [Kordiimonas gwangyangensis]|uniref:hypothetical protein n=1 Tax=Kordiimonas gwangyangensis TaxID=288022 RepID=UPI00037C1D0F|nr:hypothetical protein [Kordiimonas gwangyangensis]